MKKLIILLITILLALSMTVGCAAKSEQNSKAAYDMAFEEPAMAKSEAVAEAPMEMEMTEESAGMSDGLSPELEIDAINLEVDRKLIFRANYYIETLEFDKDYKLILTKLESIGGYAQNSYVDGTKPIEYGDRGRHAELSLRIPISKYDEFLASLEGIGNILSKSQNTDDVSAQYFDTQARIRVLKTQLERLENILEKADKLEDIITLEREITNVMYELDRFEGQKRQLDNLIDYTTVSISLSEVNEISTISQSEKGLGQRISESFKKVAKGFARFLEGLAIVIIAGSPVWISVGIIVLLIIWIVKRSKKKRAAKKEIRSTEKNKK
jgi:hypothetical protein